MCLFVCRLFVVCGLVYDCLWCVCCLLVWMLLLCFVRILLFFVVIRCFCVLLVDLCCAWCLLCVVRWLCWEFIVVSGLLCIVRGALFVCVTFVGCWSLCVDRCVLVVVDVC